MMDQLHLAVLLSPNPETARIIADLASSQEIQSRI
jgi:hypothetical protein